MMTARPTFTELIDWLDGRLATDAAEELASYVAVGDPSTLESVEWILEFVDGAASMPLAQRPPELGSRLRAVFDQLHRPGHGRDWTEAALLHDTRSQLGAVGVRSLGDGGVHLAFDCELGRFVLDATASAVGEVDVQGLIMLPPGSGGLDLAFLERGDLRRAVRSTPDGRFEARGVPVGVDELWLTSGPAQVRATLDLRP